MAVVIVTRASIPVVEMNKALAMKRKGLILMTGCNPVLWEVLPQAGSAQPCPAPLTGAEVEFPPPKTTNQTNKKKVRNKSPVCPTHQHELPVVPIERLEEG